MATKRTTKAQTESEEVAKPSAASKGKYYYASGKRKTSIARVRLFKGTGEITINEKALNEWAFVKTHIGVIKSPLTVIGGVKSFDVVALVKGGGTNSQAEAIRHGIARTLIIADPMNKPALKKAGLLTRDSRIKERKKFGLKRARKGGQFSKR